MSNYAAEPQRVDSIPYRSFSLSPASKTAAAKDRRAKTRLVDVEAVQQFAAEFHAQNRGKWISDQERLGGFCLMIKRETLSKIGPLDPWSDLGLFDTDILSVKAREAGYSLAVCRDLFIHHFGTRTFAHGAPKPDASANPNGRTRQ